jgi:intein-encoded DNA endonuclease-like protein
MISCQEINHKYKHIEEKVVKETMNPSVYVDPALDLQSNKTISIIIEFKTKPAKIAVLEAEAKGIPLTIEEAQQNVEESHAKFHNELHTLLDNKQGPYIIKHTYKTVFNGVSMELPANEIKRIAESSSVISRIYLNKKIHLDPPILPSF